MVSFLKFIPPVLQLQWGSVSCIKSAKKKKKRAIFLVYTFGLFPGSLQPLVYFLIFPTVIIAETQRTVFWVMNNIDSSMSLMFGRGLNMSIRLFKK